MGLALFKERRFADRRKLTGLLPGRLMLEQSNTELTCRPIDVSANGMGIVVSRELEPGTQVLLIMKERTIPLTIAWGSPDFGKQDMFRYGLITLNPADNLEEAFLASGCLR